MLPVETTSWDLYVDETGNFSDVEDRAAVCGLLIARGTPSGEPGVLRATLERALPHVAWPHHAAHLHLESFHLLSIERARRDGFEVVPGLSAEVLEQARTVLRKRDAEALRECRAALRERREPEIPMLRRLERHMAEALPRESRRLLSDQVRRVRDAVRKALAPLGAEMGSGHGAVIFAAAEASPGDACGKRDPFADRGTRRYGTLLVALFERLGISLARLRGDHHVRIEVLSKPLVDSARSRPVHLEVEHVAELAAGSRPPGTVMLSPTRVVFYPDAHGGLVLADAVAHAVGRETRDRHGIDRPLAEIEASLLDRFGVDVRVGDPPLPDLASSGAPRRFIARGEPAAVARAGLEDVARWAREQALEWIVARELGLT